MFISTITDIALEVVDFSKNFADFFIPYFLWELMICFENKNLKQIIYVTHSGSKKQSQSG